MSLKPLEAGFEEKPSIVFVPHFTQADFSSLLGASSRIQSILTPAFSFY